MQKSVTASFTTSTRRSGGRTETTKARISRQPPKTSRGEGPQWKTRMSELHVSPIMRLRLAQRYQRHLQRASQKVDENSEIPLHMQHRAKQPSSVQKGVCCGLPPRSGSARFRRFRRCHKRGQPTSAPSTYALMCATSFGPSAPIN